MVAGDFASLIDSLAKCSAPTISTHSLADIDGVCSAFLLSQLVTNAKVVLFDRPNAAARRVCEAYGLKYEVSTDVNPESTVLVDVDDPSLLPSVAGTFLGVVDHHASRRRLARISICGPDAPSTTYVIYKNMVAAGMAPTKQQAELILLGIISDTYRFKSQGSPSLFRDVAALLDACGKDYESLLRLTEEVRMSNSEKLVFARSFRDYRLYREPKSGLIFVLSDCEGFQSLVASRIIESLEADFALAYALVEGEVRASLRSSPRFTLHLGQLASAIASEFGGTGGGHLHAAGCNLPAASFRDIEKVCFKLLSKQYKLKEE
ncbi:MAG: DHHA1 domain-containing protein [Candidatus Micrarchaeia archaeon]